MPNAALGRNRSGTDWHPSYNDARVPDEVKLSTRTYAEIAERERCQGNLRMLVDGSRAAASGCLLAVRLGRQLRRRAATCQTGRGDPKRDDLGYGDLGCYGSPTIRTPHLDRIRWNVPLLFHLGRDPSEKRDVAAEHPEVIADIRDAVKGHQAGLLPASRN